MKIDNLHFQRFFLILSDCLAMALSFSLAAIILNFIRPGADDIHIAIFGVAKFGGIFLIAVFWYQEQYVKRRPTWEELKLIFQTIFLFALIHMVLSYLVAHHVIKLLNILFWLILLIILPLTRATAKVFLQRIGIWARGIYVVGTESIAIDAKNLLLSNRNLGYKILGFIDLKSVASDNKLSNSFFSKAQQTLDGIPILQYNDLNVENDKEIVFAMNSEDLLRYSNLINEMQSNFLFVSIVPDVTGLPLYGVSLEHFFGNDQMFLRLQNNLGRKLNRLIKRIIDIIITSIAIIMLLPFFMVIAILIACNSGGEILYSHQRVGTAGKEFACLKFRTMCVDSQQKLEKLLATDNEAKMEWASSHKLKNDPRITIVGKFLRKTSLDELPQLFNVLKGDMSLVGPRPIVKDEVRYYHDDIYYYKLVKPGITGLWQISGRSDINYAKRVRLDVWYVKNWSLWYDFAILLKTIPVLLSRDGAY